MIMQMYVLVHLHMCIIIIFVSCIIYTHMYYI